MTEDFYNRHGGMALIFGRFLPIIRTFAPILAGVINMDLLKFTLYNITGSILWVFSFVLSGFYLGKLFPALNDYLEFVVIGLIVITAIPVIRTVRRERSRQKDLSALREAEAAAGTIEEKPREEEKPVI